MHSVEASARQNHPDPDVGRVISPGVGATYTFARHILFSLDT
jgi:hypothetical protein